MIWAHCDNCIQLLTWNIDMSNWRRHAVMVTTLGTGSFTCTKNKQHELHVSFVWWTWLHIPTILPMRCAPTHTQMIAELCIVALEVCSIPTNFPFHFLSTFSTHWYKYIWYYLYTLWLHLPHLNLKTLSRNISFVCPSFGNYVPSVTSMWPWINWAFQTLGEGIWCQVSTCWWWWHGW